jgi:curli production assembly/transport component CsgE
MPHSRLSGKSLKYSFRIIVLLLLANTEWLRAQTKLEDDPFLLIDGLIVDETVSKLGRDFYELFYSYWSAPPAGEQYMIFVREQSQPGMGSRISVWLNDTELFSQQVQPRYELLEEYASYAVQLTASYISEYARMVQQLETEDQEGSGIF